MEELPVLREISDGCSSDPVDIIVIHHLLPDVTHFLDALDKTYSVKEIIGIPYSSNQRTANNLRKRFTVHTPNTVEKVEERVEKSLREYSDDGVVILDTGGYAHKSLQRHQDKVIGVVEDTNQGHWQYEQTLGSMPVLLIAQSNIKDLENKAVGQAITFSLENILRNRFQQDLMDKNVLVMGYGWIGKAVAEAAQGRKANTAVFDVDTTKRVAARLDGHKAGSKTQLLSNADIVIGTSGKESLGENELQELRNNTVIASGSSKTVEIDTDFIANEYEVHCTGPDWTEYRDGTRSLYLLNEGRPVNFLDNSVPLKILDLIFTELYLCIQAIIAEEDLSSKPTEISREKKDLITNTWLRQY